MCVHCSARSAAQRITGYRRDCISKQLCMYLLVICL
eukprot:XP_001709544.1 Hypothetical protein GL50803_35245 [Giardia lamblia ATCC 50803]